MQAVSTTIASDGMEAARRACGGHGYSLLSGLPTAFTHYVQNVTWEGDNNVMLLQVTHVACYLERIFYVVYSNLHFLFTGCKSCVCLCCRQHDTW